MLYLCFADIWTPLSVFPPYVLSAIEYCVDPGTWNNQLLSLLLYVWVCIYVSLYPMFTGKTASE